VSNVTSIVGIDLGTTYSLVASVEHGQPRVLADEQGQRLLPSVVGFSPKGELLVGMPARNQYVVEPDRTVRSIKRKMGTDERLSLAGRTYTPQEISAFILGRLRHIAQQHFGEAIEQTVITVPAYFADAARQATRDAGEIAGFEVARIINEPTAAALAYGLDRQEDQKVAIYDLGGGTFDVSIVELSQGVIEVRASHGNTALGGDDFDALIVRHVADQFEAQHGIDLQRDRHSLSRLVRAAEAAKITLSDNPYARIAEEFIAREGLLKSLHLDVELARRDFEDMLRPLVQSTLESVNRALHDAGLRARDLHKVLLVGGSTRIPLVRRMLAEHLGQEPQSDIHPDEAVALGAAIQAAIVAGEPIAPVLVDVAPRSLGIQAAGLVLGHLVTDRYSVLIQRNTAIPCTKSEAFYTLAPSQDDARIRVFQGDEVVASRNDFLGEFLFEGISPDPEGLNREVLVRFDYDVNGMVQVAAIDRRTNRSEGMKITASRQRMSATEKAHSLVKLAAIDRRLEREVDAVLRRSERLMLELEADGRLGRAEEVLALAGDLERARKDRDHDRARALMETLSEMIYSLQD
jgi:molecular chaperone DnaK